MKTKYIKLFLNGIIYSLIIAFSLSCGYFTEQNPIKINSNLADRTPPGVVIMGATVSGGTQIVLNWTDPADADLKYIKISWSPDGSVIQKVNSGLQTFTVTSLENAITDYTFTLVSVDAAGNESLPITRTVAHYDTTPPSKITGLSAISSSGQIKLSWVDPTDTDLSYIEITQSPGSGSVISVQKSINTYAAAISNNVKYSFSVVAVDLAGNKSAPVSIISECDTIAPDQVIITSVVTDSVNKKIKLNWTDPDTAIQKNIDFNHVKITITWLPGGSAIHTIPKGTETFNASALNENVDYTFSVVTVDTNGNESSPVVVAAKIDTIAPDQVSSVTAVTSDRQIKLNWTDPFDSDFDHVEITWDNGGTTPQSVTRGLKTYTATGLSNIILYTFSLKSVDKAGNKSNPVTVTVRIDMTPPAPVKVSSVLKGLGTVNFNWFDPTDADFDHVEITISPVTAGITPLNLVNPGVQTFATTPAVLDAIVYTFSIVAVDIAGNVSTPVTFSLVPYNNTGGIKGVYMIYTAEDLYNVRNDLTGDYVVMANIDLSGYAPGTVLGGTTGWTPIGTSSAQFKGTFDGNGYTISNLTINNTGVTYQALFGAVAKVFAPSGTIKNVTLSGCNVKGGGSSSCLVGQQSGGVISNCHVAGSITSSGGTYAGGLVASAVNSPIIENCSAAVDITGTGTLFGVGGLIGGLAGNGVKVTNCYATGNITATGWIGGLIGFLGASNTVAVENCYATGDVTGRQNVGGFAGELGSSASISNCYATGDVTRSSGTNTNFGGFAGYGTALSLTSSYYCGTLSAGLIDNASGSRKTGNEMKLQSTYTGWDFSAIWTINGGYPYLKNNP